MRQKYSAVEVTDTLRASVEPNLTDALDALQDLLRDYQLPVTVLRQAEGALRETKRAIASTEAALAAVRVGAE